MLEIERGSVTSHSVGKSLWKKLWTYMMLRPNLQQEWQGVSYCRLVLFSRVLFSPSSAWIELCLVCLSERIHTTLESACPSLLTKVMPTCIYSAQKFVSTVCTATISHTSSFNLWPYNVYLTHNLNDPHFRSLTSSFIQSQYDQFSHPYSSASAVVFIHSLVFSLRGRAGRNQSPVMWPVWLWHTASWASSWG